MLAATALSAAGYSKSEYSHTRVGAAALTTASVVLSGTNLETAAWVPGLHAETSVVAHWQMRGCPEVTHLVVMATDPDRPLSPCGMCRQLLFEMFGGALQLWTPQGWVQLSTLLPMAFGSKDLS